MNHIKCLSLLLGTLLISACSEEWLNVSPDDRLQEEIYYQNGDHAIASLTSVYEMLHSPEMYGRGYFIMMDIASDACVGENPGMPFDNFTFLDTDSRIEAIYVHALRGVFRANLAMEKMADIEMDEALKKRLVAECKVLRAHFNWILVTTFGKAQLNLQLYRRRSIQNESP